MKFSKQLGFGITLLLLASGFALAQNIPLNNWTVPPYSQSSHRGGITTMTDVTSPRAFIGVQPCRVADTRGNGAPIQGGIFPNSGLRTWDVTGICGIPAGADAISVNFTVVAAAGIPAGSFLLAWPTGQAAPPTAIMTYGPSQVISNAAIVPLGPSEQLNVNVSGSTHVIMDVNGYFSDTLQDPTRFLELFNNSTSYTVRIDNASLSCSGACGLRATTSSGWAVSGYSPNDVGVRGDSDTYNGVWGQSLTQDAIAGFGGRDGAYLQGGRNGAIGASTGSSGVLAGLVGGAVSTTSGTTGVFGLAASTSNYVFGVKGVTASSNFDSAGVKGVSGLGDPLGDTNDCTGCFTAGVRGTSDTGGFGVFGLTRGGSAVAGIKLNPADNGTLNAGYLGSAFGFGVYALGGMGGTGAKFFLEPHATDPSLVIKYIALEGPESGTYFRGRGKFQNGIATVEVPEDFRMVTDRDGLSIQVTPIGQMATVAVQAIDLNRIVVRGSRDVEFFYMVNGVRRSFKDHVPIQPSDGEFEPEKADVTLESHHYLTADQKRVLIQNGTYTPEGKVNMETARRLGWDKIWEAKAPVKAPESP
jgi:hypothetical protein